MKSVLQIDKKKLKKTEQDRQSMDNIQPIKMYEEALDQKIEESFFDKINKKLYEYKEIKFICKKTKIKPFYYLVLLSICLVFIVIGYFGKYVTLLIATIYPLFMTFKTLHNSNKDKDKENNENRKREIIHWLKYWVFYCFFLNFEGIFGNYFKKVYFLIKVIFLISCFTIDSRLTSFIYTFFRNIAIKYEPYIVKFFKNITERNQDKIDELNNFMNKNDVKDMAGKAAINLLKKTI